MRLLAVVCGVGLAVAAAGSLIGRASGTGLVTHATVSKAGFAVELWADGSGEVIALRRVGERDVTIVRGAGVEQVEDGHLSELASHRSVRSAWFGVHERYGLTLIGTRLALARGDQVERPALMTAPSPSWQTSTYTRVWDFDTDLAVLRRSVTFALPRSVAKVAGLQLADVARVRTRGPGAADTGLTAMILYSSNPTRRGIDDRELTLNAAAASGGMGAANSGMFRSSSVKLVGRGYDARLVNANQAILRYRGTYVAITASWGPTRAAWRLMLSRFAQ